MPHVTTINVFEVERIRVTWDAENRHYQVAFEGGESFDRTEINVWRDHGGAPAPELIVERAPEPAPELPTMELDL